MCWCILCINYHQIFWSLFTCTQQKSACVRQCHGIEAVCYYMLRWAVNLIWVRKRDTLQVLHPIAASWKLNGRVKTSFVVNFTCRSCFCCCFLLSFSFSLFPWALHFGRREKVFIIWESSIVDVNNIWKCSVSVFYVSFLPLYILKLSEP